jgi:hypothetical protein
VFKRQSEGKMAVSNKKEEAEKADMEEPVKVRRPFRI